MLTRLAFNNFRCFKDRQELDLRPVTVVLGKNNSGKSAFTRAAMVFQTGFATDTTEARRAPMDLDRLGHESVASFTDLVYRHSPHGHINVQILLNDNRVRSIEAQIQNIDGERRQVVSKLLLELSFGIWELVWSHKGSEYQQKWTAHDGGSRIDHGIVEFQGLVPKYLPPVLQPGRESSFELARHCTSAYGRIRYLSPFREPVRREHYLPVGTPETVGDHGQHFAAVLAHDQVRGGGRVRQRVNELMYEVLPDWSLEEMPDGRLFTTVLQSRVDPHLVVNIADTGSGVVQLLPMLVQQALDDVSGQKEPTLYIVEEPELHLHPAAHAQLADLYLRAAKTTGNRFLIETHSESLLLRLRRRIAEELASPDDVGVYFVEHDGRTASARRIFIDESGMLSFWPDGVFTEDFEEVRALTQAQMRRSASRVG
ncbi:hypothetical protein Rhe02_07950 [Rhizocola hellebori]|uniref:DUF3696 domain-containing protein n=1 Tax=Rhizocola hellebori TaxID=1392758 RepID=A0A8J3VE30_9ACTN|nr:DUF3696 domain-containing protein [Rhizocola hellebori]GIH02728.1 hypothetical protein Rhe02_07950 [Rhizocola hellebori]